MAERFMAELTRRGMGRQTAYALVRKCALEAKKLRIGLKDVILQQDEIKDYLTPEEVEEIMDPHTYLGSSVQIVDNVLEESSRWF